MDTPSRVLSIALAAILLVSGLPAVRAQGRSQASAPVIDGYAAAKAAADRDEASLDAGARETLRQAQQALIDGAIAACATPNPDFSAFTVVMALAIDGRVERTWRQGDSPLAICLERHVRDQALFVPPRTPFYSVLEISFAK